jgi:NAD(P)-dependent dehydrogenase (short-subunit alcohol dehydrogenase family)
MEPAAKPLRGKTVLITGATSGIGLVTARELARQGARVVLVGRSREKCDAALAQVQAQTGSREAEALLADLSVQQQVRDLARQFLERHARLDVLVNNAGGMLVRPAIEITRQEWSTIVDINITGTFFLTQRVGRHMIETKQPGAIVSVSSVHAIMGVPNVCAYGTTKAAISQITRMLAIEWAEHGIRVNAVAPGRLITESPVRAKMTYDPAHIAKMTAAVPMKRLPTVEEVAAGICYLASPRAGSVTGQVLVLDGGLTVA